MTAPLTEWRTLDEATGKVADVRLHHRKRRGRKPTAKTMHGRIAKAVKDPAPRNSVRFMLDGKVTPVLAGGAKREPFSVKVERHRKLLRKRKSPLAREVHLPTGQAALWYEDVICCVPRSGREVARQIARLCSEDSQVTVPLSSLADAVGRADRGGRLIAYTQRGIEVLIEAGWLRTETIGPKGNQETTYYLMPGDRWTEWFPEDEDDWLEEQALSE